MSFKIFNDMAPHAPFFRFVKFDLEHDMDLIILVHILQEQSKPKDFFFFFFFEKKIHMYYGSPHINKRIIIQRQFSFHASRADITTTRSSESDTESAILIDAPVSLCKARIIQPPFPIRLPTLSSWHNNLNTTSSSIAIL